MDLFFKDIKKLRILTRTLIHIILLIFIPVLFSYNTISQNPLPSVIKNIEMNQNLKNSLVEKIIDESKKNSENLTTQEIVRNNEPALREALNGILSDESNFNEITIISDKLYNFYINGDKNIKEIDISKLVDNVYSKITPIDPELTALLPAPEEVRVINLDELNKSLPSGAVESINKAKGDVKTVVIILGIILLLLLLLLLISSEDFEQFIRQLITLNLSLAAYFALQGFLIKTILNVVKDQYSDTLIKESIETVGNSLAPSVVLYVATPLILSLLLAGTLYLQKQRKLS